MWPFCSKKTLASSGVFQGFTDYHSHILPGVDDGIRTMEDALEVLRRFEQLGVVKVWCTPHIMEDIPNTTAFLRERFAQLEQAYTGPIQLRLAAENMLDSLFEERLAAGDLLPLGDASKHLLVETSYFNPPAGLDNILFRIKTGGYCPVLAHPERYAYMNEEDYRRLHDIGILFQLNLFSLTGAYGPLAKRRAEWMIDNNMYTYRGTDIHSINLLERTSLRIKKI